MLLTIASFLISFLGFYFIGYWFITIIKPAKTPNFYNSFFIGLIITTVITSYISIFFPINKIVTSIFFVLAIILMAYATLFSKHQLFNFKSINKFDLLCITFLVILVAFIASAGINIGDTWLYHVQNLQWTKQFPVVPGLGHLQPQLGQNSHFFIVSALLSIEIKGILGSDPFLIFPINGIVLLILISILLKKINESISNRILDDLLLYSFIFALLVLWFPKLISSLSPDIICSFFVIFIYLFIYIKGFKLNNFQYSLIASLVFLSITFKLSMLFLGIILIPILINSYSKNKLLLTFAIALVIFLPFIIRNYYLTGYLVYPISFIDVFNPEWKIPIDKLDFEVSVIKSWARAHTSILENKDITEWFPEWISRIELIFKSILSINLCSVLVLIISAKLRLWKYFIIIITLQLNILFWFINAPDPRFAFGFLIMGAAFNISFIFKVLPIYIWHILSPKYLKIIIVLFLILITLYYHRSFFKDFDNKLILYPIGAPVEIVQERKTNFTYYFAGFPNKCNNHELPCTSRLPKEGILLRGENFKSGFILNKNQ